MTRLTDEEKEVLRLSVEQPEASQNESRPPWMVEPTPANLRRYMRAVSQSSGIINGSKPIQFGGAEWKL
jgi:hypothetical protein